MKIRTLSALVLLGMSAQSYAEEPPAILTTPPTQLMQPPTTPGGQSQPVASPAGITTDIDRLSYSAGVQLGQGLRMRGMRINIEVLIRGIRDGYNAAQLQMKDQDMRDTLAAFQRKAAEEMQAKMKTQQDQNTESGKQFLAQNKTQPGIKTTMTGLQYKVLTEGTGEMPTDKDTIVVNYQGTTIDGKEFDSSYKRGQPMTAPLKYMIPGWVEALQMMKKGSTWMLYIPANLAYGDRGAPPAIGPNQTLIFKVELLDVKKG